MTYTKLFSSIITSTVWSEDHETRIVWITMLAMADKNGEVQGSIPGLARIAAVSLDGCRAAISKFLSPDEDSRTQLDQGRRIEEIDGGWHLLNYAKYREMASKEDQVAKATARTQRYRERKKRNLSMVGDGAVHAPSTPVRGLATEAEAEADSVAKATGAGAPAGDAVKDIFDEGVALLVKTGTPAKQARGIVGQWRSKAKNDARVAELIREASARRISQPVEWFGKALAGTQAADPWAGVDV